jgi:AAA+ superfamily predicted ATPase
LTFPDSDAKRRYDGLVGLDALKSRLAKEGEMILNPEVLSAWSGKHYGKTVPLVATFQGRTPLFIFAGDVGTGKTALAKSFGDGIARTGNIPITLFNLSLATRGKGAVGEMTALLSAAFAEVTKEAGKRGTGHAKRAVILLVDEADSVVQSREFAQMHHEDRAGVNAVIRGIDGLVQVGAPVLVVMCTNRLNAIDPAVLRRAVGVFEFVRPDEAQRRYLLQQRLEGLPFSEEQLGELAKVTGPTSTRRIGLTYSDLTDRFLPSLVIDAYPEQAIAFSRARMIAESFDPTPPFGEVHK